MPTYIIKYEDIKNDKSNYEEITTKSMLEAIFIFYKNSVADNYKIIKIFIEIMEK